MLNHFGFFDVDQRKDRGSKLLAIDEKRAKSPNSKKLLKIDHKYGGKAKEDQLVRHGHYPKISEMIDMVEEIAK